MRTKIAETNIKKGALSESDEYNLTHYGFFDSGITVTDEEGNDFMASMQDGDKLELRGKDLYHVKITNIDRRNAHRINFKIASLGYPK